MRTKRFHFVRPNRTDGAAEWFRVIRVEGILEDVVYDFLPDADIALRLASALNLNV